MSKIKKIHNLLMLIGIIGICLSLFALLIWIPFADDTKKVPYPIGMTMLVGFYVFLIGGIILAVKHRKEIISEIKQLFDI